jgi:heat shock protein HtpX
MAMNFWESQRSARSQTTFYLTLFIVMTVGTAALSEWAMRFFAADYYSPDFPLFGVLFIAVTLGVAGYNYSMYQTYGGGYVARSMGANPILPTTSSPKEKQLLNIVEEVALATSLPLPHIYLIPSEQINAFAAGLGPQNAAIAITAGALERLNREEVQGVIAHEFGHIYNGDMRISMRLAAMVMGFFFLFYMGLRLIEGGRYRSQEERKGGNPAVMAGLILMISGALTWLFGSLLKAAVSRQREYLADACAVQFTRNPAGLANALRKIAGDTAHDMPSSGAAYAHMYLEDHSSLFATHPPIRKRIAAIEGGEYTQQ